MKAGSKLKSLIGQVLNLSGLLDYQTGAVVSRTLISQPAGSPANRGKPTGTVTLFAFDKGQGLSEHVAPFDAMAYILDGAVKITISGRPFNLKQSEMIIMPARKPHALKATKRFKMLLVMIKS